MSEELDTPDQSARIIGIEFDEASIRCGNPNIDHEREVAVYDLLDDNSFRLSNGEPGPYRLTIGVVEDRLALSVCSDAGEDLMTHLLAMSPFRRVIREYFTVCESYYEAIKSQPPSRIQVIDMGRRGLHDEGSRILVERLSGKIDIDHGTARRLFTLICALHWKA